MKSKKPTLKIIALTAIAGSAPSIVLKALDLLNTIVGGLFK